MTFEQWLIETGYNTLYTSVIDAMELAWNAAKQHGYTGKSDSDQRDTTTRNVHTRFANRGPLPPPVVDFSTDHCAHCGEVLNQCTCPQVLQRVDFGDEEFEAVVKCLNEEIRQLEEQLEKAKCCENCKHYKYNAWTLVWECTLDTDRLRVCNSTLDQWEAEE